MVGEGDSQMLVGASMRPPVLPSGNQRVAVGDAMPFVKLQ